MTSSFTYEGIKNKTIQLNPSESKALFLTTMDEESRDRLINVVDIETGAIDIIYPPSGYRVSKVFWTPDDNVLVSLLSNKENTETTWVYNYKEVSK